MSQSVKMAAEKENVFKKEVKAFTSSTTMHGLRFVTETDHIIRKILWSITMLVMISLIIVGLTQSVSKYYQYDSVTSTKLERNDSLILPAVTICNVNSIKKSVIVAKWPQVLPDVAIQMASAFLGLGIPHDTKKADLDLMRNVKFGELINIASFNSSDVFVSCIIGIDDYDCSKYVTSFFTDYGICFTFNSDQYAKEYGMLSTSLAGDRHGISLTVDINPDEYIIPVFLGTGLHVMIHDPFVYPRMKYHKFVVEAGREVFVAMNLVEKNILPKPYSKIDCINNKEDPTLIDKYLGHGVRYSEEGCLAKCMMEMVYSCDCSLLSMDEDSCSVFDFYTCSSQNLQYFFADGLKHCNFCLPTCQSYKFDYQISTTDFPNYMGETYGKEKGWKITNTSKIRERYAKLYIYFESLTIKKVYQVEVMDVIQLLSNIGGLLGLCLGMSTVTVLEIIDCVVMICIRCCKEKRKTETRVIPLKAKVKC